MVQGGYSYSGASDVANSLLHQNLIYGRLRVLACAKRLLWLHVRHTQCIDRPRARADAHFTGGNLKMSAYGHSTCCLWWVSACNDSS